MGNTNAAAPGPLSSARENSTLFCLNLVACTAYKYTIEALFISERDKEINPSLALDADMYLQTLFANPLERDV